MEPEVKPFEWSTAQRVELKHSFLQQTDFVFININIKGYKEEDVRYAFSADELLIEIRDKSSKEHRIMRLCETLSRQIDVPGSNVQFLVDFICFKLAKAERGTSWPSLGYTIADWTNPLRGQMKSNFMKSVAQPKPEPVVSHEETKAPEQPPSEPEEILSLEEQERRRDVQIREIIERNANNSISFMNLETASIYSIF